MADQPAAVHGLLALCTPHKSRADGAIVAQELDQRMSTVLEGSTKAVVAIKFFGFFRQHPIHGPDTSAPGFEKFRKVGMPATGPRADRGRANAGETAECIDLAASGLAPSYLASPGD